MLSYASRLSVHIVFFDRPLVAAFFMGLCTDSLPQALAIGFVLELFWIDSLRLGAVVPPTGTLSFLLLYPLCLMFDWTLPQQLPLPLFICMLFAHASAWLERWQREQNEANDARLELWVENTANPYALSPECSVALSHWRVLWSAAALYMVCFGVLFGLFTALEHWYVIPMYSSMSWHILYGAGLLGAVLALRVRRAYIVLAGALFFGLTWQMFF